MFIFAPENVTENLVDDCITEGFFIRCKPHKYTSILGAEVTVMAYKVADIFEPLPLVRMVKKNNN